MTLASVALGLNRTWRHHAPGFRLRPLIFMTDTLRTPDPAAVVASWSRPMARAAMVIFRHYDHADRAALAMNLARVCRARGVPLLIAADPRLSTKLRTAGVHWPDALLRQIGRRAHGTKGKIVTAAAHDAAGLRRAARAQIDAVLLSPVFSTESHSSGACLGRLRFASLARSVPLAVYALGGLDETTARSLVGSGAAGLAGIGAFKNRGLSR